jgi:hypothetical protein
MTFRGWVGVIAFAGSVVIAPGGVAAQESLRRTDALDGHMKKLQAYSQRLPLRTKARLSSGATGLLRLAERWQRVGAQLSRTQQQSRGPIGILAALAPLAAYRVSDPRTDGTLSVMDGFVQSQTSTAWCGANVVVTFKDSGSFLEATLPGAPGGFTLTGVSRSTNRGTTFTDRGFPNPGADPNTFILGDAVVACSDANTFRQANTVSFSTDGGTTFQTGVAINSSSDGGLTWGAPIMAVGKPEPDPGPPFIPGHFLDKPWLTIDPANANTLYVTYTDFDSTGALCGTTTSGSPIAGANIELVRSTDGGTNWDAPVIVRDACDPDLASGSQVAVGPTGDVHVAWELAIGGSPNNAIEIAKSTDAGVTFASPIVVATVTPVGGFDGGVAEQVVQPRVRANDAPSLAIDRTTGKPTSGYVYVAWNDGRNNIVPDPFSDTGTYAFGDVLLSRSTDGGATFTRTPVRVNTNFPEPAVAFANGTDQWSPGIAVDQKTGYVGACWYDKRLDAGNFQIDRYCGRALPGGARWANLRKTTVSFPALTLQDSLIAETYMGEYDSLASDTTKTYVGFRGAYGDNSLGNPDVKMASPF